MTTWTRRSRAWNARPSNWRASTSISSTSRGGRRSSAAAWVSATRSPTVCRRAGLPAITDMSSVIDAMRTAKLKTLAMATPFEQFINDRLIQYLAAEKIEITNNTALGIKRNVEIRRLPIPVEYAVARKTYLESATKPDGIYIPCGGWGSIHNIELLEKDLDTTVVTWLNAMIWSSLRRGKVAGAIHGFGKLLASL